MGIIISLIIVSTSASSQEITGNFKEMWPILEQPWYFSKPYDVASDGKGYIYVVNESNSLIQKFTTDGNFVTQWGREGSEDGAFMIPHGIAADTRGYVYVADTGNHRIQKFTANGDFVLQWGKEGSGEVEFDRPYGITVDRDEYIYVADTYNHRIQKFEIDGEFVNQWGQKGDEHGEFKYPYGIAADSKGNVYVVDTNNCRIQKFDKDGIFLIKWGQEGDKDGEFKYPYSITVDKNGDVYVTDQENHRIQKFDKDGKFLCKWGEESSSDGSFDDLRGIAADSKGYVYVTDILNQRIQKFASDGQFMNKWGSRAFNSPNGIAIDSQEYIYVADTENHRIQKFSPNWELKEQWDGNGEKKFYPQGIAIDIEDNVYVVDRESKSVQKLGSNGESEEWKGTVFQSPYGITIDSNGSVYVTDQADQTAPLDNCVWKFSKDGNYEAKFGIGLLDVPYGVAVDSNGYIYVTDASHRVHKLRPDGEHEYSWGKEGSEDGDFYLPRGIAIDSQDHVYIADTQNNRVQVFDSDGNFLGKWGEIGNNPGQMNYPHNLGIFKSEHDTYVYITDTNNHRVQMFKKLTFHSNNKAIIVAGGGPYPGNNLWNATQMCANFAYRTLTYQGFSKKNIAYLTSVTDLDLDGNGISDDAEIATNENFSSVLTDWASGANDLILYLVDHGGKDVFLMNETETLSASQLNTWLDIVQETISGKVILIYDACNSGSFLSSLTFPGQGGRIIITSAHPGQQAHFLNQGMISFSDYFWTHTFNGRDIHDSFYLAKEAIHEAVGTQTPLLSGNVPVSGVYIGNGTQIHWQNPVIRTASYNPETNLLHAEAEDEDGIARVWAVIIPRDYNQKLSDNPVIDLPSVDLMPVADNLGQYEATYSGLNMETYQIAIYANDRIGNTATPKLITVSEDNMLKSRAIIVVGGFLWPGIEYNAKLAYNALTFQGYTDDDIYFMSPVSFSTNWGRESTLANLRDDAIGRWAAEQDTQNVLLYLVGSGGKETFQISDTEILSAQDLDNWLDDLQDKMPGKVTVVYDADYSGSFLPLLAPPEGKERILISGTSGDHQALFLSEGVISFSNFFWKGVGNGMNVRDAFSTARNAMFFLSSADRMPMLEDTGDDEESLNGQLAMSYTIGAGIRLAGDDPLVGSVSSEEDLNGKTSAIIWVENVTTTGEIRKVWAVITPPDFADPVSALPTLILDKKENDRYEGTYKNFYASGTYKVAVYVMDTEGNVSPCKKTSIYYQSAGSEIHPDDYEDDDTPEQARFINVNDEKLQHHNFYDTGDEDWIKFHCISGKIYTVEAADLEENCDVALGLYDSSSGEFLTREDIPLKYLNVRCPGEGIGYVKAWNYLNIFGEGTAYSLKIYTPTGPSRVNFTVRVTDFITEEPIEGAEVKIIDAGDVPVENIDSEPSCRSRKNGACHLNFLKANDIEIAVSASRYMPESAKISIRMTDEGKIMKGFRLKPYHSADYNPPDNKISLSELLRVIQLYNKVVYHCDLDGEEDKYAPGDGDQTCTPHDSDYKPEDWRINLSELLRLIQFYNASGYKIESGGEDGFAPGK